MEETLENTVPTVEDTADLGLLDMLLDITKDDLTEEEVIESLKMELNKRSWNFNRLKIMKRTLKEINQLE